MARKAKKYTEYGRYKKHGLKISILPGAAGQAELKEIHDNLTTREYTLALLWFARMKKRAEHN